MLQLKNIVKTYAVGGTSVKALRGVDLEFRDNEFVCILGPSGCGKTTLLNIVGGLDQYTSGDLVINGVSTKAYRDADWDAYRNHSIGFVFQTYNLIPHQTVLANVELALTLSGVSRAERTERAKAAIEQVGLGDQLHKRPNQLSGGQMQRVAIARALVNNPDILLADEPTGALDSETSVQVMDLLKEISRDRLVIMVTHNPDLADRYSTRIVRLLDGLVTSDTSPEKTEAEAVSQSSEKMKKPSMSFLTALSLSLNNLMTKKTRTFLTAFAGSIGIIGIALILALSSGLQDYISRVEKDTLSSYPITLEQETMDFSSLIQSFTGREREETDRALDRIYTNNVLANMFNTAVTSVSTNDLAAFKTHIEASMETLDPLITAVSYGYGIDPHLYSKDLSDGVAQANPNVIMTDFMGGMGGGASGGSMGGMDSGSFTMSTGRNAWTEMLDNREFLNSQYDLLAGEWPENYNEVVLIVDAENEITDIMLYSLGLSGPSDLKRLRESMMAGEELPQEERSYTYDEILTLSFALVLPADYYVKSGDEWTDMSKDSLHMQGIIQNADEIKIVGILRPNADAVAVASDMTVGYLNTLSEHVMAETAGREIVMAQLANPEVDVFTGIPFESGGDPLFTTLDDIYAYLDSADEATRLGALNNIEQMLRAGMPEEQIVGMFNEAIAPPETDATYDGNLGLLGVADETRPTSISIYASSFENKEAVIDFITQYNDGVGEDRKLTYTDYVGLLMSSVTTVINAISYVLIAFVSISLVVSSIMIGIITYISVLERTKEIGILRSIGASKRDISRVFNAETLIIGFVAGALGILVTLLLCIPANAIIYQLTDIRNVAALPLAGGALLILISMALSFIAGLIPSRVAANKDPVVALRTE